MPKIFFIFVIRNPYINVEMSDPYPIPKLGDDQFWSDIQPDIHELDTIEPYILENVSHGSAGIHDQ